MNKKLVILFFLVIFAAAGFYCYEHGCFDTEIARVEKALNNICDPSVEDCSELEEDLEV